MSVDSENSAYCEKKIQWEKLRDCAAGDEAVKLKGRKYLPRLSGQTDEEYKAYLNRPTFYGATARTIDGLSGMIFRKPPQFEIPDGLKPLVENVTLDGLSLLGFAEAIVDDVVAVGRCGILVDHPTVAPNMTKAQAEAANIRPFLKHYSAEQIFNWRTETRNNTQVLTQLRLWEWATIPGDGEFDFEFRQQIRVLDFNEVGQYRQRIFIKVKFPRGHEEWVQFGPDIIPVKNGAPLSEIPFFFVGVRNCQVDPQKPPLIDMANVNLSHFVTAADLEHGAHFTGLPTAVITGHSNVDDDGEAAEEYRIGAATAWVFPNPETDVKYLEFQGQGLEALERRLAKKEEYMAFLGARMLSPEKKAVETAETAQIHRMGESSVLSSLAKSVSEAIEKALKFMSDWAGFPADKITFRLNDDFIAAEMEPQKLVALLQLWQSGGIAFGDLLDNLKRGEIVRDERQAEDIRQEVSDENPFMGEPDAGQ